VDRSNVGGRFHGLAARAARREETGDRIEVTGIHLFARSLVQTHAVTAGRSQA